MLNSIDVVNESFEYVRVFNLYQSPFLASGYEQQSIVLYKAIIKGRIKYLSKGWDKRLSTNLNARGDRISKNLASHFKLFFDKDAYNFFNVMRY